MMMICRCLLVLAVLFAPADHGTDAAERWSTYHNERFGFRLDYPAAQFKPDPPPENGDGLVFRTADGQASIRASGGFNVLDSTLPKLRADELKSRPGTVKSQQLDRNRLYVVGTTGGETYHLLVLLSNRSQVINTLEMRYPETAKGRFERVATRVVASFRPGRSEWYDDCCE